MGGARAGRERTEGREGEREGKEGRRMGREGEEKGKRRGGEISPPRSLLKVGAYDSNNLYADIIKTANLKMRKLQFIQRQFVSFRK